MKIRLHPWLNFLGTLGAGALVVAFCLVLLWHDPLLFWNDDYEISILPVFADMARSWSEGNWPLLSPYSWVCGNLAGEFQYGTISAVSLLVMIVSVLVALNRGWPERLRRNRSFQPRMTRITRMGEGEQIRNKLE